MYAIFENGSKQYKASVGDEVKLEKIKAEIGATVTFPVLLTADGNDVKAGSEVKDLKVSAEVVSTGKDKKIIVFKYKSKKNERKKQGHRQPYTVVKVTAIGAEEAAKPAKKAAAKKPAASKKKAAPAAPAAEEPAAE